MTGMRQPHDARARACARKQKVGQTFLTQARQSARPTPEHRDSLKQGFPKCLSLVLPPLTYNKKYHHPQRRPMPQDESSPRLPAHDMITRTRACPAMPIFLSFFSFVIAPFADPRAAWGLYVSTVVGGNCNIGIIK